LRFGVIRDVIKKQIPSAMKNSPLSLNSPRMLVRFDHVASGVVNADHGIV
jgi:hypothetical protein